MKIQTLFSAFAVAAFLGSTAQAAASPASKAAADLKNNDTRTVTTEITNEDGNPCIPDGKSYQVELQVKQATYNRMTRKVEYSWETAKTIIVDQQGRVSEVCAE